MKFENSAYRDDSGIELGLELGLGLSIGGGGRSNFDTAVVDTDKNSGVIAGFGDRILTAVDFPYGACCNHGNTACSSPSSLSTSSCSSSSSLSRGNINVSAGVKRSADSVAATSGVDQVFGWNQASAYKGKKTGNNSQVVGWPPVKAGRKNIFVNQAKKPELGECNSAVGMCKSVNSISDETKVGSEKNHGSSQENADIQTSLFVKVSMDGNPIGRKINVNAHRGYESLAEALRAMFLDSISQKTTSSSQLKKSIEATVHSKSLVGLSDFVLTYEDKDGDWMLVGDVPWRMFLITVKRLRIMKKSDASTPGI